MEISGRPFDLQREVWGGDEDLEATLSVVTVVVKKVVEILSRCDQEGEKSPKKAGEGYPMNRQRKSIRESDQREKVRERTPG